MATKTQKDKIGATAAAVGMQLAKPGDTETPGTVPTAQLWEMADATNPVDMQGWEQRGLPVIVKPADMPPGAMIIGRIDKFVASTNKEIKNPLMYLTKVDGVRIAFPVTAVIESAVGKTDAERETHVGWDIAIQKTGVAKPTKGKKGAHLFNILMRPPQDSKPTGKK